MNEIINTELNIRIGHLVLEGISLTSYQQHQLKETIETELAAMFTKNGIPGRMRSLPSKIKSNNIQLQDQKPAPVPLGKQIAASVFNSITRDYSNE
jgi:hypothetical protein